VVNGATRSANLFHKGQDQIGELGWLGMEAVTIKDLRACRDAINAHLGEQPQYVCDGCGDLYEPSRKPNPNRQQYCATCREDGTAERFRKRGQRARQEEAEASVVFAALDARELGAIKIDGFDEAIMGFVVDDAQESARLVYSFNTCIAMLEKQMPLTDALEHWQFNVEGSLAGFPDNVRPLILYID
jgi:hypothetical protein